MVCSCKLLGATFGTFEECRIFGGAWCVFLENGNYNKCMDEQCPDLLETNLSHKRPIEGSSSFSRECGIFLMLFLMLLCSSYRKEEFGSSTDGG